MKKKEAYYYNYTQRLLSGRYRRPLLIVIHVSYANDILIEGLFLTLTSLVSVSFDSPYEIMTLVFYAASI